MRTPVALLVALAVAPVAFSQTNDAAMRAAAAKLGAARAAGTATASQAGDEALSCDQLQTQLAAIASQSNVQGVAGQMASQLQGVREAGTAVEQMNVAAQQAALAKSGAMANGPFGGIAKAEVAIGEAKLGEIAAGLSEGQAEARGEPASETPAASASQATDEPAAEPKKKGGFLKRFGQVAGAAGGLRGGGAGGAANAIGAAASQLGGLGGLAGGAGPGNVAAGPDPAAAIANSKEFKQAAQTLQTAPVGAPQINALATLGPEMARGNQLMQLARAKGCEWAAGQ
jgi:hypothetical protein